MDNVIATAKVEGLESVGDDLERASELIAELKGIVDRVSSATISARVIKTAQNQN